MFVFIPGANVLPVKRCIILCPSLSVCAPLQDHVTAIIAKATAQGYNGTASAPDTFIAGHSLGGICAQRLGQAYLKPPYQATIEMGSYAEATTGAGSTQEYPTPLLTVGAELDGGLGRPAMIGVRLKGSDAAAAKYSAGNSTVFQLTKKPVVILPGLDHSSFCPGFKVPGDSANKKYSSLTRDDQGYTPWKDHRGNQPAGEAIPVDMNGCARCPTDQSPKYHRADSTFHQDKYQQTQSFGRVTCSGQPREGAVMTTCYPYYTSSLPLPAPLPANISGPTTCMSNGIVRTMIGVGTNTERRDWTIGCRFWKHVYCANAVNKNQKGFTKSCVVTKRIDFLYADSCYLAGDYPGRNFSDFDYSKCTADGCPDKCLGTKKSYGYTEGGVINHPDSPVQVIVDKT